jgi:hypothetical protein
MPGYAVDVSQARVLVDSISSMWPMMLT